LNFYKIFFLYFLKLIHYFFSFFKSTKKFTRISKKDIDLNLRPDIFLALEWIDSNYSLNCDFARYLTSDYFRKYSLSSNEYKLFVKNFKDLDYSLSVCYFYLFKPVIVYSHNDRLLPINLKRTSILLSKFEFFYVKVVNLDEEKLEPKIYKLFYGNKIYNRIFGALPDLKSNDNLTNRIKSFTE